MKYERIAESIIEYLGGEENVSSIAKYSDSSIRVHLEDNKKIDPCMLRQLEVVRGCFSVENKWQILFHPLYFQTIYQELIDQLM